MAGTFNGFDANATNMVLISNGVWQGYVVTTNLVEAEFVFVAGGQTWGEDDQTVFEIPLAGTAESPGTTNIVVSNGFPSIARIRFYDQTLAYSVEDVSLSSTSTNVWINEVDYDQAGTDSNEWIELAGPAGMPLDGFELALINQSGSEYGTFDLADAAFTFADEEAGFGFFVLGRVQPFHGVAPDYTPPGWTTDEIQNGPGDSILLRRKTGGASVHLIDYEADNTNTVEDAVVAPGDNNSESDKTIYLRGGPGSDFADFGWTNITANGTPGAANVLQVLAESIQEPATVVFTNLVTSPSVPEAGDDVWIQVELIATNGAANLTATTFYRTGTNGLFSPISMSASGTTYTVDAPIPAQPPSTRVEYYVFVEFDGAGTNSPGTFPPEGPEEPLFYVLARLPIGTVWINEVNYNPDAFNSGNDTNEFIEVAGPAGASLSDWSIELLNIGGAYATYTIPQGAILGNDGDGNGFFVFGDAGVQNVDLVFSNLISGTQHLAKRGAIRLINETGFVEQELSYGIPPPTSFFPDATYIGHDDDFIFPPDQSLGLTGAGTNFADFAWTTNATLTAGTVNDGQTLTQVPIPGDPEIVIVDFSVGTNVQIVSTAPESLTVRPEYSTNISDAASWTPVPEFANTFSNGTNTTVFDLPDAEAEAVHFRIVSGSVPDTPPVVLIVDLAIGAGVEIVSTGTNTWSVQPEYTTNLVDDLGWSPIGSFTNTYLSGTNTTVFGFPSPGAPHMKYRIRQIAPP